MSQIVFPSSPDNGDKFLASNGTTYQYDSATGKWKILAGPGVQGPVGPAGTPGATGLPGPTGATGVAGLQKVAYLRDERHNDWGGGASVVGWQDRALNTKEDANNLVVLSNDKEFTLSAGEYQIEWSAPGKGTGRYQTKLTNVTDGTIQEMGSSEYNASGIQTRSFGCTRIKITTDTTYKIEQYCQTSNNYGLGEATSNIAREVYTQVTITDLSV